MARHDSVDARATMVARSAVTDFILDVRKAEARQGIDLFSPTSQDLGKLFNGQNLVPDLSPGCSCTTSFNPGQPYYSTDNSMSGLPASGWLDRGKATRSVPPYTVALILRTKIPGARRNFRVLLQRTWPYAAYSQGGPIVIMGTPSRDGTAFNAPSVVKGAVYSTWNADAPEGGFIDNVSQRLKTPEAAAFTPALAGWYSGSVSSPVTVGPQVVYYRSASATRLMGDGKSVLAYVPHLNFAPTLIRNDRANVLDGDVDCSEASGQPAKPDVGPGNQFDGKVRSRKPVSPDPFKGLAFPPDTSGSVKLELPALDVSNGPRLLRDSNWPQRGAPPGHSRTRTQPASSGPPLELLDQQITLSPTENSTGGPTGTRYLVSIPVRPNQSRQSPPTLTNCATWKVDRSIAAELSTLVPAGQVPIGSLLVEQTSAGIHLTDCTLVVDGDLDLGAVAGGSGVSVIGDNATLIVNGTLVLAGGRLDARDRGMVICAKDIVIRAGGDYHGLLVAEDSILIQPMHGQILHIRGGVLSKGPGALTLKSVQLDWDPRYLKALHGAGTFEVTRWQPLLE